MKKWVDMKAPGRRLPQYTDPVVSAHGIEAIGATDEDQVVISGNQNFDEVVTLVLNKKEA